MPTLDDQIDQLDGARCARHPTFAASFVCTRCGDYACPDCRGGAVGLCANCAPKAIPSHYFLVSTRKFIFLSFATFGLYQMYWAYQNWAYIKRRDQSDIWPIARAFFHRIMLWSLMSEITTTALLTSDPDKRPDHVLQRLGDGGRAFMAIMYFAINAMDRIDGVGGAAAFVSFLFLLPSVLSIQQLNAARGVSAQDWGLKIWQWPLAVLGLLLALLTLSDILFPWLETI